MVLENMIALLDVTPFSYLSRQQYRPLKVPNHLLHHITHTLRRTSITRTLDLIPPLVSSVHIVFSVVNVKASLSFRSRSIIVQVVFHFSSPFAALYLECISPPPARSHHKRGRTK